MRCQIIEQYLTISQLPPDTWEWSMSLWNWALYSHCTVWVQKWSVKPRMIKESWESKRVLSKSSWIVWWLTADDSAEFDQRPSFILQSMAMRGPKTEKMMTIRKKQYMAQFIAVILKASYLKQNNNQDVLRCWDGGGHGGPVEHGGGQLGLTLVSWQQEGGSL